ncbi:glycosyltransferase family 2 protein [Clostridium saccharoperbutylacetonicum]|jgi:GT2 family glycosyltransferase
MKKGLVSIITLSYNNSKFYRDCLTSVFKQTYKELELLIVDDCSKNFEKEEIMKFIENNNINKIDCSIRQNKKNTGIVRNYNDCIKRAKGEYIFYLCIDDALYDEKVIEDLVKYFKQTDSDIVTGYMDYYDPNLKGFIKTYPDECIKNRINASNTDEVIETMTHLNIFPGACTPFRKRIIEKTGSLDENFILLEDYPRYIEILKKGIPINFIERKLIKYRLGGITTNNKKNPILENDLKRVRELNIKNYMEKNITNKFDKILYKGKVQIGWGISNGFIGSYSYLEEIINKKIEYLVDSDENKVGNQICGKTVFNPEKVLNKFNNIFIWIFSDTYYCHIADKLKEHGLKEFVDFSHGTKEYIEIMNKIGKM